MRRPVVETIVESPFEESWDGLPARLAQSPFRILASDETARVVVVALAPSSETGHPLRRVSDYVDCGRVGRSVSQEGRTEVFDYDLVEPGRHVEVDQDDEAWQIIDAKRSSHLEVRASLHLQPMDERRTRVTVHARYTLTFGRSGTARRVPRRANVAVGKPQAWASAREVVRFTTFEGVPIGTSARGRGSPSSALRSAAPRATCVATGRLESALIAVAGARTSG